MRGLIIVLFMIVSSFAQDNYSKKDIEKMIAKMVVLGFTGTSIDKNSQIYKDIEFGLGGVILFDKDPNDKTKAKNIENKAQLKKLNQQLQSINKSKLLISIDQEGGVVQRLKSEAGFVNTLKASEISQNGEVFAKKSYEAMAKDLSSVGINLDFAPSVDLAIAVAIIFSDANCPRDSSLDDRVHGLTFLSYLILRATTTAPKRVSIAVKVAVISAPYGTFQMETTEAINASKGVATNAMVFNVSYILLLISASL